MKIHGVIYGLYAPDGELRYVGQTTTSPKQRLASHLSPSSQRQHSYVSRWLASLSKRGERPTLDVVAHADSQGELDQLETAYIEAMRQLGARLANLTDGGGGCSGHVVSPETRAKISLAQRGKPRKKHTPETRAKISAANVGNKGPARSAESLAAFRAKRCGHSVSIETRDKISRAKEGHRQSDAHRAAISKALTGKPKSKEHAAQFLGSRHPGYRHDISNDAIRALLDAGISKCGIARNLGVSSTFVHRRIKQLT